MTDLNTKFQNLLTNAGFANVQGFVAGTSVCISGAPAITAKAAKLIGRIYNETSRDTFGKDDGFDAPELVVWFKVPSLEEAETRGTVAIASVIADGTAKLPANA